MGYERGPAASSHYLPPTLNPAGGRALTLPDLESSHTAYPVKQGPFQVSLSGASILLRAFTLLLHP